MITFWLMKGEFGGTGEDDVARARARVCVCVLWGGSSEGEGRVVQGIRCREEGGKDYKGI